MIGVGIGVEDKLRISVGPVLTEKERGNGGEDEDRDPEEEGRLERISDLARAFHPRWWWAFARESREKLATSV